MSYSFYDWNQAVQQRNEYAENQLKNGSPVVAVAYDGGILMLTIRGTQRKLFEVYDRLMMGALGSQSDIEGLRLAAIDQTHKEGFERSPDDVSIQRLVGFELSPAVKRIYNNQQAIPLIVRAIFAEMNQNADNDHLFVLGYDGEFRTQSRFAVAAGTVYAEKQAEESLREATIGTMEEALKAAIAAWGIGRAQLAPPLEKEKDEDDEVNDENAPASTDPASAIRDALKDKLNVEVAVLQRTTQRESKFRLLKLEEIEPALAQYR